jgi:ABC-2 type transport system permease protein
MSRLWADFKGFAKGYTRSKGAVFFAFMLPILLILLFGPMFSGQGSGTISLPVQNLDGGAGAQALLESLNATNMIHVVEIPSSEDLSAYMSEHSLSVALQIPSNFSAALTARAVDPSLAIATISIYGDPTQTTYQTAIGVVNGAIEGMNFQMAQARPAVALHAEQMSAASGFTYMDYFLPGVVGMTVLTTSFFTTTSICANYRSRGYFKLLATTDIGKHEWLLSKFLFMAALLSLSLLTTFAVGKVVYNMQSWPTPMTFALIAAGAFAFTSLGILIGSVIKDPESGMAIANAIGFPMMFLSGSFFPVESFPSFLQTVAKAIPLTYLNDGLRATMVYSNDVGALMDLLIILAVGVVLMMAGSRLMSWKEA